MLHLLFDSAPPDRYNGDLETWNFFHNFAIADHTMVPQYRVVRGGM